MDMMMMVILVMIMMVVVLVMMVVMVVVVVIMVVIIMMVILMMMMVMVMLIKMVVVLTVMVVLGQLGKIHLPSHPRTREHWLTAGHEMSPGPHWEATSLAFPGVAPQHSTQCVLRTPSGMEVQDTVLHKDLNVCVLVAGPKRPPWGT